MHPFTILVVTLVIVACSSGKKPSPEESPPASAAGATPTGAVAVPATPSDKPAEAELTAEKARTDVERSRICDVICLKISDCKLRSDHQPDDCVAGCNASFDTDPFYACLGSRADVAEGSGIPAPTCEELTAACSAPSNSVARVGMSARELFTLLGSPQFDVGGTEGEACFVFARDPNTVVCFDLDSESADWRAVQGENYKVDRVRPVRPGELLRATPVRPGAPTRDRVESEHR
jgi:hypothetical protein